MKASNQNFIIDILAFIGFVFLSTTGIIIHYLLPAGSGHARTIWGLSRHDWGAVHFYIAISFLLILAFHLVKHWKWIKSLVKGRKHPRSGKRAILGLVGLFALLTIAILPLLAPVETNGDTNAEHKEQTEQTIRGSMSLGEVAEATGVPVAYLLQELKLPPSTSAATKLKDLKNAHPFDMEIVRQLVADYQTNQ